MLAEAFDSFILDSDGVVYIGESLLPGVAETLEGLYTLGKEVVFITNDPYPSTGELVQRFRKKGLMVGERDVVAITRVMSRILVSRGVQSVYVLGSSGLREEIERAGLRVTVDKPQAVAVGYHPDLTLGEYTQAARMIAEGALFLGANRDCAYPTSTGLAPAAGAFIRTLEVATGKRAICAGKPSPFIFHEALSRFTKHARVAVVGDMPDIDMVGAHQVGLSGILISSTQPQFPSSRDYRIPQATIRTLGELFAENISYDPWVRPSHPWPETVAPAVGALIMDTHGKVCLVKRTDSGIWALPTGWVERGESTEEAVVREVREETGYEVAVKDLIGVYSLPEEMTVEYPDGRCVQCVTVCYFCEHIGGRGIPDGREVSECIFFPPDTLPEPMVNTHRHWIETVRGKFSDPPR